jgi:Arc/MetJ-type ribon-helix-helix transcriptional regulator
MTIHLPNDLESSIQAVVHSGQFASVDDAMAEAARLLLREIKQGRLEPKPPVTDASPDPLLGVWRDAADEMDEIVADAMRQRREEPWRTIPGE